MRKKFYGFLGIFSTFLLSLSSCSSGRTELICAGKEEHANFSFNYKEDDEFWRILESVNDFSSKVAPLTCNFYNKVK